MSGADQVSAIITDVTLATVYWIYWLLATPGTEITHTTQRGHRVTNLQRNPETLQLFNKQEHARLSIRNSTMVVAYTVIQLCFQK